MNSLEITIETRPVGKSWPDGTPRLTLSDLSYTDRSVFLRFHNLIHRDEDGDIIIELTVAEHEAWLERKLQKTLESFRGLRAWRPKDRVGRNQPCPCGSGKKYKRCCIDSPKEADQLAAPATALPSVQEIVQEVSAGLFTSEDIAAAIADLEAIPA